MDKGKKEALPWPTDKARQGGEVLSFVSLPAVALNLGGSGTTSVLPGVVAFAMTAVAAAAATSSLCIHVGSSSNGSNVIVGKGGGLATS
jgi:hypothetical protein